MLQNIHRVEGDVTYVSLTRGQETVISTTDLERVLKVRWYAEYVRNEGCYRARGRFEGKPIFLSRYLLNVEKDMWVDHINFDTLDNRRENLRVVTPQENRLHQRRKPGQSGLLHIHELHDTRDGSTSYYVTMMRHGVRKSKSYPYTPEGLLAAQDLVTKWQEDFSYEPIRTTQSRPMRPNLLTSNTSETGPHIPLRDKHIQEYQDNHTQYDKENDDSIHISLSRGQEAIIDKADVERVKKHSWHATPNPMGSYYAVASIDSRTTYLHRFLLDAPDGMYVDHINHNTLDNRRSNLRLVTNQVNNVNRDGAYSTSKTGIRGVSVHKGKRGLMYVFRCHCVTCKVAKYFPYTEEGLADAKVFAEAHYAAMEIK